MAQTKEILKHYRTEITKKYKQRDGNNEKKS
jgi:hypothetical protein